MDAHMTENAKGRKVMLPGHFHFPVTIEKVKELGSGVELTVRRPDGGLDEVVLSIEEFQTLSAHETGAHPSPVDPEALSLLIESNRIRYAWSYDPHFAVRLSGIRTLPHQIEAVYQRMLPQPMLRFLLADDPGAGKTIMAGLLLKELKLRGAVERVLAVVPAALTIQWQDELLRFFQEPLTIITSALDQYQLVDPWQKESQVLVSMDYAKQEGVRERVWQQDWDLLIVDEAHKCSAYSKRRRDGTEVVKTKRYQLVERLTPRADHVLFLTATPHHGDDDRFGHFLRLLDPDLFLEPHKLGAEALRMRKDILGLGKDCPWAIRRMKEELRDVDGRRLFPDRHSITVTFRLGSEEYSLYKAVTSYINEFLPKGVGRQKQSIALTRTVFQRRLASSTRAIHESLKRRHEKLKNLLAELEALSPREQAKRLEALRRGMTDEEMDEDDLDEGSRDRLVDEFTAAMELDVLRAEIARLRDLADEAGRVRERAPDSKLNALQETLERAQFRELKDGRGKLLIFTEHRDTMEHVREHLEARGYSVCTIHGGMNVHERKDAQEVFRTAAQICVATEAAGEGINLQFCHLMINYDMPWNPTRLDQRMGRIHRIGQERDVYVFNFVADSSEDGQPIIEGRILTRLLEKIERIREFMQDRVYDVIGEVLALNDVNLPEMLRETAYDPKLLDEYLDRIDKIDPDRLREYEEATGIALAKSSVDLSVFRQADAEAEEKRLMPEYIQRFFLAAAERVRLRVEQRADGLLRVEHVVRDLRSERLGAVRRLGKPAESYPKITFDKRDLERDEHLDAVLLGPGHPLFAAVDERLNEELGQLHGGVGVHLDPAAENPYWLHYFTMEVQGDTASGSGTQTVYGELVAVWESDGGMEIVAPDVFHNLAPHPSPPEQVPDAGVEAARDFLRGMHQIEVRRHCLEERKRFVEVSREYTLRSFEVRVRAAQDRVMALRARHAAGEDVSLALQRAEHEVTELERSREARLRGLERLATARTGPVQHLASLYVLPPGEPEVEKGYTLLSDPDSEQAAMDVVMRFELERGWEPSDVSRENLGFDVRSLGPADPDTGRRDVRRIEVKGRKRGAPIRLTTNEWLKARQLRGTYWLYVVWDPKEAGATVLAIQDPAHRLERWVREIRTARYFEIPARAFDAVEKEDR
jgi:superfamily II DNA or RNA helicase